MLSGISRATGQWQALAIRDAKALRKAISATICSPLMTALTTILAMSQLIFSDDMAGQLGGGMAIVIIGGMIYATAMTLIIIPVIYDIFFKRQPLEVDLGSENLDDVPDDAAEFIAQTKAAELAAAEEAKEEASEDPQ